MKKYVLGVDGGGTKTHGALYGIEADSFDLLEWGSSNHENMKGGYEELRSELGRMLDELLGRNNVHVNELQKCVFGMGGVDTRKQHETISSIIRGYGITDFILCNDAFLGIKAGCKSGYGICAINGSGFSTAGINPEGKMLQIGGQGDYTGDKGGGFYLVPAAVRSAYEYLYKGAGQTLITEMLFDEFQVKSRDDFMDSVTESLQADRKACCQKISRIVYTAAGCGDETALGILDSVGTEYARCIGSLIRELDFSAVHQIEIALAGSQFVKGEHPRSIDRIREMLKNTDHGYSLEIKPLEQPCVAGALLWALEGVPGKEAAYKKIVERWRG